MSDVAETLDPLRLPLQGERLIEASAGTGKTFTIAALYLRLLLGLRRFRRLPRPLTVEELLVVTFTEAATAELRAVVSVAISTSCASPVCVKPPTIHCTNACWKRSTIKRKPRSGCC